MDRYLAQLILEVVATTGFCLIFFRASNTFLGIFLAALEFIIVVLLPPNNLPASQSQFIVQSDSVLSICVVFCVLLFFTSRGADETRRLLFGLLFGTLSVCLLLWLFGYGIAPIFTLPLVVARTLIIFADSIFVVYFYSQLYQRLRLPGLVLVFTALLAATIFDGLLLKMIGPLSSLVPHPVMSPANAWTYYSVRAGSVAWFSAVLALSMRYMSSATDLPTKKSFSLIDFVSYRKQYELVRNIAMTDELTGVCNRRHLNEILPREVERAKRYDQSLSLAFIDIDHFKRLNDTWGHGVGDKVLIEVAQALQKNCRDIDVVCRYGGEEFVVLLPTTSRAGAVAAMNKVREKIMQIDLKHFGTQIKQVTVSVGIAACPEEVTAGDDLIKLADRRLYTAKETGRNRIVAEEPTSAESPVQSV